MLDEKYLQTFCSLADKGKKIELVEKFKLICFHAEIQTLVVGSEIASLCVFVKTAQRQKSCLTKYRRL